MPDIKTFSGFKDWLLLAIIGALISVGGMLMNNNRNRLEILEIRIEEKGDRIVAHAARLATIEAIQISQRDETFRRLDRIERKLDEIRDDE